MPMAVSAYRSVLRAARVAFQGEFVSASHSIAAYDHVRVGDAKIYSAARLEARKRFTDDKDLAPGDPAAQDKVKEAYEVARILRQNVVQGEAKGGAQHYRMASAN